MKQLSAKGDVIPDGFHWGGHRIIRNCKGSSKRPEGIDPKLWQMLERKKIIEEEDAKALAEAQEGKSGPSGAKSSRKKKSLVARLEATQSPPAAAKLVGPR